MAQRVRAGAGAYVKTNPSSIRRREDHQRPPSRWCVSGVGPSGAGEARARLENGLLRRAAGPCRIVRVQERLLGTRGTAQRQALAAERLSQSHSSKKAHCGEESSPESPIFARTVVSVARRGRVGPWARHAKKIAGGARQTGPWWGRRPRGSAAGALAAAACSWSPRWTRARAAPGEAWWAAARPPARSPAWRARRGATQPTATPGTWPRRGALSSAALAVRTRAFK